MTKIKPTTKLKTLNGIKLITGPMYAGKSNAVVEEVETCIQNDKTVICFKHTFDDSRFGKDEVISRTGKKTKAFSVKNYKDIIKKVAENENINAIVIDELQFFGIDKEKPEELKGFIKMLQDFSKNGKEVILAGLDKDFKNEYFPMTKRLIGDGLIPTKNITYLKAQCSVEGCCKEGTCTARIVENKELVVVGNGTKYKAVCSNHHNCCNKEIDYKQIQWKNIKNHCETKVEKEKKDSYYERAVKFVKEAVGTTWTFLKSLKQSTNLCTCGITPSEG